MEQPATQRWDLALPWYRRAWTAAERIEDAKTRWHAMITTARALAIGGSPGDVQTLSRSITQAQTLGRLEPPQAHLLLGFCHMVRDERDALEAIYQKLDPNPKLARQLEDAAAGWYAEQTDRAEMLRWRDRRLAQEPAHKQADWERDVLARHDPRRQDPEAPLHRLHTIGRSVAPALPSFARNPAVLQHRIDHWLRHHEQHTPDQQPDWGLRAEIAASIADHNPYAATAYLPDHPARSTAFKSHSNLRVWYHTGQTTRAVRAIQQDSSPSLRARWANGLLIILDARSFDQHHPTLLPLIRPHAESHRPKPYHLARLIGSRWALGRPDQAQRVFDIYPQLANHPFTRARRHALASQWDDVRRVILNQPTVHLRHQTLTQAMGSAKPPPAWLLSLAPALRVTDAVAQAQRVGLAAAQRGNTALAQQALDTWQSVLDQPITDDPYGYSLAYLIAIRYHLDGPAAAARLLDAYPRPGSAHMVAGWALTPAQHLLLWQLTSDPHARYLFAIRRANAYLPAGGNASAVPRF